MVVEAGSDPRPEDWRPDVTKTPAALLTASPLANPIRTRLTAPLAAPFPHDPAFKPGTDPATFTTQADYAKAA